MEVEHEDEARMRIHMTIDGESGFLDWAMARLFLASWSRLGTTHRHFE